MVEVLYLKNRKRTYRSENYDNSSFSHPAKMHPEIAQWIINKYTKKGETILDPFAGVGTTLVEGMILRRNVIGIEIEDNWVDIATKSCNIHESKRGDLYQPGTFEIIKGSSVNDKIYGEMKIDAVITSPPYGIVMQGGGFASEQRRGGLRAYDFEGEYNPFNIGNFRVDSLEYRASMTHVYINSFNHTRKDGVMAVVTKNFYNKGEYIKLWEIHQKFANEAGWTFESRYEFKLPYITHWQKINRDKFPDRIVVDWEDVVVYRKVE